MRSLTDYGAFVTLGGDLGGVDALLHVSDIAWGRVNKPADVLTVGQAVEVKVLKVGGDSDRGEKKRISVGLKQLQPHPWDGVAEKFKAGERVRPLRVGNHWGIDMDTRADVDRAHALALEHKERYAIQKVTKITDNHGTYGFYFMDRDGNWWEFQYAGEGQGTGDGRYDQAYARGDLPAEQRARPKRGTTA